MHAMRRFHLSTVAAIGFAALLAGPVNLGAQQAPTQAVAIDNDDIGGVVRSPNGPEAGVWVIAETTELPTKFARMVVTDDQGRYVIPDLPKAKYRVWVRGYGLVDSPKVDAEPGKLLNLTAVIAPSLKDAAQYYPAIYWAAMIKVPDRSKFPGNRSSRRIFSLRSTPLFGDFIADAPDKNGWMIAIPQHLVHQIFFVPFIPI